jgi:hypothetical protein
MVENEQEEEIVDSYYCLINFDISKNPELIENIDKASFVELLVWKC